MSESPKDKQGVKDRIRQAIASIIALTVLVSLWVADALVQFMLLTRSNERRIRPTERVAWPKGLKQQLMRQQDNTCVYCGYRRAASSLDIDHIIPVVRGGGNQIDNLQVICRPCNQRKGLQTDQEFRARYSRLVPRTPLRPPSRRISQNEFRAETQRTIQGGSVQQFKRTRFISKREKIVTGCLVFGGAVAAIFYLALVQAGADEDFFLWPSLILGGAAGFGVWIRAYMTGAMIEDDQ